MYTLVATSKNVVAAPHFSPVAAGDDGDCMYIILRGSCNVHVDPDFDETAQAGALQKASLQPKVQKKKHSLPGGLAAKHLLRPSAGHSLDRLNSTVSTRSDTSATGSVSGSSRRSTGSVDSHARRFTGAGMAPSALSSIHQGQCKGADCDFSAIRVTQLWTAHHVLMGLICTASCSQHSVLVQLKGQ